MSHECLCDSACCKDTRESGVVSRALWALRRSARLARARARADETEVSPRSTTQVSPYGLFMGRARKGQNVAGAEEESRATNLSIPRSERQRERFGSVLHLAGRTIHLT